MNHQLCVVIMMNLIKNIDLLLIIIQKFYCLLQLLKCYFDLLFFYRKKLQSLINFNEYLFFVLKLFIFCIEVIYKNALLI